MAATVPEIGRLRDRVFLQSPVGEPGQSASGEPAADYAAGVCVWAAVETLTGREFVAQQQLVAEVSVRVWLKWRPDVRRRWRLTDVRTGRVLYAHHVTEYRTRDRLEVLCTEKP